MMISQIIALIALGISLVALTAHFVRLVRLGKPEEFTTKTGNVTNGVVYSNTTAMLPQNKESAIHHLPTYTLGIIFHIGTFTSLLCFVLFFFPFFWHWMNQFSLLNTILPLCLLLSAGCGLALFIKRLISKDLKIFSTPDDYLSNLFTTLFQLFTAVMCFYARNEGAIDVNIHVNVYYAIATLLFLYMPLGKLRHVVYFFSARYHLGFFYGWRNVWPPHKKVN